MKVPTEWKVINFSSLAEFRNGLNFGRDDKGEAIKIVGVADFQNYSELPSLKYLDVINVSNTVNDNDLIQSGDVLYVRSNGNKDLIGRCLYFPNVNEKLSFSGFTIRGRVISSLIESEYFALLSNSEIVKQKFSKNGAGTNISNLSQQILNEISVPLPSIREQKEINKIITTWNKAISKQEELIKEKVQLKKGLLQKLLSSEVRFSEFNDIWKTIKLKDIINEYTDRNNKDLHEAVSVGKYGLRKRTEIYSKDLAQDISKNKVITKDTLSIGMGSTQIDIGILKTDNVYSVSAAYSTFRIVNVNVYFLEQLLLMHNKKLSSLYMITGARQGKSINKEDFLNHIFLIPSKKEQEKIAEVLSLVDNEINLLKNELEELKLQKKALMQKLLTGQVRIKV